MKYQTDWSDVKVGFEVDRSLSVGLEMIPTLLTSDKRIKEALWEIGIGGSIDVLPLIDGEIAYFGVCDKNFYAVDIKTGREIWRFAANGIIHLSNAVLYNDLLYFGAHDGCIYAITKNDGKLVWKFRTQGKIDASPVIKDGILYVSSYDKNLYAISATSGTLVWKYPLDSMSWNMALHENTLLVACYSGNLYAISTDKRLLWKFRGNSYFFPPPAVKDGIAYQSGNDDNFYAIDFATGRLIWKFRGGDAFDSTPSFHGNLVITGCRDNNLYALDKRNGNVVWKFRVESTMISWRHLVRDGVIYFGAWNNNFYAINADNGRLIWKFRTNGPIDNGSCIADSKIIFGSFDCNLYCLDMQGRLIWKFPTSMSTPSRIDFVPQEEQEISVETIWKAPEEEKKEKESKKILSDYGVGENLYATDMSKDYIKRKKGVYINPIQNYS